MPDKWEKGDKASKNLREQYERAKSGQQPPETPAPGIGSEHVQAPPTMVLKPGGKMAAEPDRQAFNARQAKDDTRAKTLNDTIKNRHMNENTIKLDNDRNKDNDDRSR